MKNAISKAGRLLCKRKRHLALIPLTAVVAFGICLMFPVTALAEPPGFTLLDLGMSLKNMICYWLLEGACWFLNLYNDIAAEIGSNSILSAPFSSVLGSDMYSLTRSVYNAAIVPLAESILALFMLVQLVKISQRIDATSTLPAVKEIVFLAVIYVLLHWFIVNALDVMQAIYQIVVDDVIPTIGTAGDGIGFFSEDMSTGPIVNSDWDAMSIGSALMVFIVSILSLLIGLVAYIIALVVTYARAWQIYVYAAFSAIPMSLLGFDETRQMGVSFIKNFASVCLAGAVMMFLFVAYPYIISGALAPEGDFTILSLTQGAAEGILVCLKFLAISILLIIGLLKSGSWAREILGG